MDLKLDTLHKKPKVYHIGILTVIVLAAVALLLIFGGSRVILLCCLLLSLHFLVVTFLLIRSFFLQIRYNLYSYNTIIYFGFALFTLFVACTYLILFHQLRRIPSANVPATLISILLQSAKNYTQLTFPFLFCFSAALIVSNLSLIRNEGYRPVNLLGIILAVLLVSGEALIFLLDRKYIGTSSQILRSELFINLLAVGYLYFECMLLGAIVADSIAARYVPSRDKDYLIILGCGIRKDGTPTPLLRGRIETALDFSKLQETEGGKKINFVLSGGRGADECISEAECMRRYLEAQGIPAERMILEDRSSDTLENMRNSKALIFEKDQAAKIAYSTTNYHVFRAGLKARRVKMRAQGMGCKSKWYFWPNAAVREFVGLLSQHRVKQGAILFGMIGIYIALTLLYSRL